MMLPISLAPTWLRTLAHFNPIYYVVAAARHLTLGELTDLSVVYAFLFMVPLTFFVMWWATRVFTKAVM
jgi:ABC-2 type transport system permease protein